MYNCNSVQCSGKIFNGKHQINLYKHTCPTEHKIPSQNEIEQLINKLVINSSLPISFVEQPDFKSLINSKQIVVDFLKSSLSISLEFEGWSSITTERYLGITAKVLLIENNKNYVESVVLGCESFTGNHTAEKTAEKVIHIVSQYGIEKKVRWITTDNASTMIKTSSILSNDSPFNGRILQQIRNLFGVKEPKKFIQQNDTRWMSKYDMVVRALDLSRKSNSFFNEKVGSIVKEIEQKQLKRIENKRKTIGSDSDQENQSNDQYKTLQEKIKLLKNFIFSDEDLK
ncbi:hypothetical protein ACTFIW_003671 [Dictyostelium discoideum]